MSIFLSKVWNNTLKMFKNIFSGSLIMSRLNTVIHKKILFNKYFIMINKYFFMCGINMYEMIHWRELLNYKK